MTPRQLILDHAGKVDRFMAADISSSLKRDTIQRQCSQLCAGGLLLLVQPGVACSESVYASPQRIVRRHALIKLDTECMASRRTLAGVGML